MLSGKLRLLRNERETLVEESVDPANLHQRICEAFGEEVAAVGERWNWSSPCSEWDARDVLEHVIGFHDVLLLRPLGAKPQRPKDDPVGRWLATLDALIGLLRRPDLFDGVIEVPAMGKNPPSRINAVRIMPILSLEVFIHSWDLAKAAGREITLDHEMCRTFLVGLPSDETALFRTGMYNQPKSVPIGADAQTELLTRLGRDPDWHH